MLKRLSLTLIVLIVPALVLAACGQAVQPSREQEPKGPKLEATTPSRNTAVQTTDNKLAEARKEGSVAVYNTGWSPDARNALTQAFKEKYGINVEFSPFARGSDLLTKIQAEQRAGLYTADVFGAGGPTLISTMKPEGLLGPIEPLLCLPEVTDANSWIGGKLPFMDKDKLAIGMIFGITPQIVHNTQLIKKGEITSFKDILKPQYKGKISLNDPTVTGSGNAFLSHLAVNVWNLDEARDFLRRLLKDQDAVVQRDNRQQVEWIAKGKYAIGLGPLIESMAEFLEAGAPIAIASAKEGTLVSSGPNVIAVPVKLAHPNATAVFVNWLLSKEGQTIYARNSGRPSLRADVSTDGFNPLFLATPGEKLFMDSEDFIVFRGRMQGIAREIVEEDGK